MPARRVALLIATDRYQDSSLSQLSAPASDVRELAAVLRHPDIAGFDVSVLYNRPFHLVGKAVGEFYRKCGREDLTLLYFSGHGIKDIYGDLYLAMKDTERDNLQFTGLHGEKIRQTMEGSRSRQKVLILDCCYAGAFPAGHIIKGLTEVNALEQLGGKGCAVLTSSDATQYSFEGNELVRAAPQSLHSGPSSLFTQFLITGLKTGQADLDGDGDIALDELYTYVHDQVTAERPEQRPKIKEDVEGRIIIAQNIYWTVPSHISVAIGNPYAPTKLAALEDLGYRYRRGNGIVRQRILGIIREFADDDSKQVSNAASQFLAAVTDEQFPAAATDEAVKEPPENELRNLEKVAKQQNLPESTQQTAEAAKQTPEGAKQQTPEAAKQQTPEASGRRSGSTLLKQPRQRKLFLGKRTHSTNERVWQEVPATALNVFHRSASAPLRSRLLTNIGRLWTGSEIWSNAAILTSNERIAWVGPISALPASVPGVIEDIVDVDSVENLGGGLVTPGLIDAHTHPVYGGNRYAELAMRSSGLSPSEIAAAGGGLRSTVTVTRATDPWTLANEVRGRMRQWLLSGTTTIEAKTGYHLTREGEISDVRMLRSLEDEQVMPRVHVTFLAGHAVPPEFFGRRADYVEAVSTWCSDAEAAGAESIDVYCDEGRFFESEARRILTAGRAAGLLPRVHVCGDTMTGAARLAAELGCASADVLDEARSEDVDTLAQAGVVAVVCPATALQTGKNPPVRQLLDKGIPVALGSNHNPGGNGITSMSLVITLAISQFGMSVAEALRAATLGSAQALRAPDRGAVTVGRYADIVLWDADHEGALAWEYNLRPLRIWHGGVPVPLAAAP